MKKIIFTLTSLAILGLSTANAQVGIGTNGAPNASSVLELQSTNKGFLPPRMAVRPSNPVDGLTIYNTTINCLEFFNGTGWKSLCDGNVVAPLISGGACNGEPEFFTFNNLEYKPVESGPTGNKRCWLDRNLGAAEVTGTSRSAYTGSTATADYIAAEQNSFGDLYQWGRATEGHEKRNSDTYNAESGTGNNGGVANFNATGNVWNGKFILRSAFSINNWVDPNLSGVDNLWQGVNGINNPCPIGYRIPTEAEWLVERNNWGSQDQIGAFNSPLRLSVAGDRVRDNGSLNNIGSVARYWSSSISNSDSRHFEFDWSFAGVTSSQRSRGFSVRCIKN